MPKFRTLSPKPFFLENFLGGSHCVYGLIDDHFFHGLMIIIIIIDLTSF